MAVDEAARVGDLSDVLRRVRRGAGDGERERLGARPAPLGVGRSTSSSVISSRSLCDRALAASQYPSNVGASTGSKARTSSRVERIPDPVSGLRPNRCHHCSAFHACSSLSRFEKLTSWTRERCHASHPMGLLSGPAGCLRSCSTVSPSRALTRTAPMRSKVACGMRPGAMRSPERTVGMCFEPALEGYGRRGRRSRALVFSPCLDPPPPQSSPAGPGEEARWGRRPDGNSEGLGWRGQGRGGAPRIAGLTGRRCAWRQGVSVLSTWAVSNS